VNNVETVAGRSRKEPTGAEYYAIPGQIAKVEYNRGCRWVKVRLRSRGGKEEAKSLKQQAYQTYGSKGGSLSREHGPVGKVAQSSWRKEEKCTH